MNKLAQKTVNGAAINIFVTVSKTVLQFAVVLPILARVLTPADFGLVGMAMAFVAFFTMFNDLGISAALVRAKDPSRAFWSTAFWTNFVLGCGLTIGVFYAAPWIAGFYGEPQVEPLVEALSAVLFMHCIMLVPMAWLQRNFRFRTIALIDLCATLVSAAIAIWAALAGAGVWALVYQQVSMFLLRTLGSLLTHRAPLRLTYKFRTIVEVLPFSLGLTGTGLVGFVSRNSDSILIGRFMGSDALGFYGRAYQIMLMPVRSLAQSASFALYPAMSELQNDRAVLGRVLLKAISILSTLIVPMMTGVAIVAAPFVGLVFGEQWAPVVPILQSLAFVGIIQSIMATSNVAFKAIGRSDILLRWSLIRMVVFVGVFLIGIHLQSLPALAAIYLVANIVLYIPFQLEALRHLKLRFVDLIGALTPQTVSALFMAACLLSFQYSVPSMVDWADRIQLLVLIPLGVASYGLAMLVMFRKFVRETISEAQALFLKK